VCLRVVSFTGIFDRRIFWTATPIGAQEVVMGRSGRYAGWLLLVAGCAGDGRLGAPGASTLVRTEDGKAVYAVNVDEGTLARYEPKTGAVRVIAAGGEPTRIARAGDRLFVTLRTEGALAVFRDTGDGAVPAGRTAVGAEPYGVVATADGSRVYVAISLEDRVVELDGETLAELRSWPVLDEPRWLALAPSEHTLFAASVRNGTFTRIDLESGETSQVDLPVAGSGHGDGTQGPSPAGIADILTIRITGDPAVTPDGHTLAIPTLYVDNTTPVTAGDDRGGGGGGGYTGDTAGVARINPVLVLCDLDAQDVPDPGSPVFLAVDSGRRAWRSYPSAAVASPDSRYFAVSLEGSNAVLVVDTHRYSGMGPGDDAREIFIENAPGTVGLAERPVTAVATAAGPRGMAFTDRNTLLVHGFLDRRIEAIDWRDAIEANEFQAGDRNAESQAVVLDAGTRSAELDASALPPEIDRGRRLFWSAVDDRVASPKGGVSCATCHFDGRNDGLTWTFGTGGPHGGVSDVVHLQTPSLAGVVSETVPLTWSGDVASVGDEALETSSIRMGGNGLMVDEVADIEAYVDWSRLPEPPAQDPDRVAAGKALFESTTVGCATCHSGPRFTDGLNHEILGELLQTPSLTGVAASAPYLHDGGAETLADVLAWAATGAMGNTAGLDPTDLRALEAYLRSI
jgi:DNA-binding beta-propeller fold protein YncE/mono/diheme cytochrome c family protein